MSTYTVNISLTKKLADLAHDQVKKGYYGSLSEVIRDALRNLFEPEIPVIRMTSAMIKKVRQAHKDHLKGKSIRLDSVDDLDNL
ncbi:MAG: ribbon-helix-helix domain-containing protein [Candidatus Gottesmanbacteria bacterium]|nr:ribbon-helix-helix domain-containing protein [Candidatus Gottesmanbacteria bacterium]